MPNSAKIPSPHCLDLYRLVVARGLKQLMVAELFGVTPSRVSHVVRRVRRWVNHSIGDWLFPGRDDLRFYVALACEQIRVDESPRDPEKVVLAGRGWTYTRTTSPASTDANVSPSTDANVSPHLTSQPVNSTEEPAEPPPDATPWATSDLSADLIDDLGRRLAHLLILWKKSRKLSAAFKSPSA